MDFSVLIVLDSTVHQSKPLIVHQIVVCQWMYLTRKSLFLFCNYFYREVVSNFVGVIYMVVFTRHELPCWLDIPQTSLATFSTSRL